MMMPGNNRCNKADIVMEHRHQNRSTAPYRNGAPGASASQIERDVVHILLHGGGVARLDDTRITADQSVLAPATMRQSKA